VKLFFSFNTKNQAISPMKKRKKKGRKKKNQRPITDTHMVKKPCDT